jgi:hypothetical protein
MDEYPGLAQVAQDLAQDLMDRQQHREPYSLYRIAEANAQAWAERHTGIKPDFLASLDDQAFVMAWTRGATEQLVDYLHSRLTSAAVA